MFELFLIPCIFHFLRVSIHPNLNHAQSISAISFEIGISWVNSSWDCKVSHTVLVTVTLTLASDLIFRKNHVQSIPFILFRKESQISCVESIWIAECRMLFCNHCDIDLNLWP